jgi:hypothetical protein
LSPSSIFLIFISIFSRCAWTFDKEVPIKPSINASRVSATKSISLSLEKLTWNLHPKRLEYIDMYNLNMKNYIDENNRENIEKIDKNNFFNKIL